MRRNIHQAVFVAAVLFLAAHVLPAEVNPPTAKLVEASLLADVDAVAPGQSFTLGIRLIIKPHWHIYWVNPGESGNATHIKLQGPAGVEFGPVGWPLPTKIEAIGGIAYGYENEVFLLVPVKIAKDFQSKTVDLQASAEWVGCQKEECVEGSAKLSRQLPISMKSGPVNAALFDTWKQRLPDSPADTAKMLAGVTVQKTADGSASGLTVQWANAAPAKIEFFPISTNAAAIENITIHTESRQTNIRFKTSLFKPENVPGGQLDSLIVYEDASGRRHGIPVPVRILATK